MPEPGDDVIRDLGDRRRRADQRAERRRRRPPFPPGTFGPEEATELREMGSYLVTIPETFPGVLEQLVDDSVHLFNQDQWDDLQAWLLENTTSPRHLEIIRTLRLVDVVAYARDLGLATPPAA